MDYEVDKNTDENEQIAQRRAKLASIRKSGIAYPNDFKRDVLAADLLASYSAWDNDKLTATPIKVAIAGRILTRRMMGKASFVHIQDMSGKMQIYVKSAELSEGCYEIFKTFDLGDIVGITGIIFRTKTGELSVKANNIRLLTKALRPLPDKWHGLADQELKYRQRYVDLIVNEKTRTTFKLRTAIVQSIRNYLLNLNYLEVETPMMHCIPGGATAKPFVTHHNTLDMDLYLRIAPELYLKRLVVGGLEKVFEINRCFRNEGLSTKHNPEFTTIEFYAAYHDYADFMNLTESIIRNAAEVALGTTKITYQNNSIDLGKPFARMTLADSVKQYYPEADPNNKEKLMELFDSTVEAKLIQPTFITDYPTIVSPLARKNENNPEIVDRFELFVAGRELANAFSELNDPEDQANRFKAQVAQKDAGDEEAMHFDADYITALEYGMPPTAGAGIGIDRLVMLLTDSPTIRDVLLFPQLRKIT